MRANIVDNAIKFREEIGTIDAKGKKPMQIAFSGTSDYLHHTGITMTSILMNNPERLVVFHLMINGISAEDKSKMEELANKWHCKIYLYYINDDFFKSMLHRDGIAAFFYRFLISPVLKGKTDRVLYMDGDVMCRGNLSEFFDMQLGNVTAACVRDKNDEVAAQKAKLIGTHQYFNSGVMLINVDSWCQRGLTEKACQMAIKRHNSGKPLRTHDQDILNVLMDGYVRMVSPVYNTNYNVSMKAVYEKQWPLPELKDARLVHFTGVVKPWRTWVQELPGVKEYNEYRLASPWKDVPLVGIKGHKDIHQAARNERRLGNYKKMFYYYWKYAEAKLKGEN